MWYKKKKVYNTKTVWRGSRSIDDNEVHYSYLNKIKWKVVFIQCVMDQYEESNATIWARHPKRFKNDTCTFDASKELVMCMPFDFIKKDKKWTYIDNKWLVKLMEYLKKAQSSNIKQIRFIRHIKRLDIYENSWEYESEDDSHIYKIFLENDTSQCVNFGQINDIIEGEEEWLQVWCTHGWAKILCR